MWLAPPPSTHHHRSSAPHRSQQRRLSQRQARPGSAGAPQRHTLDLTEVWDPPDEGRGLQGEGRVQPGEGRGLQGEGRGPQGEGRGLQGEERGLQGEGRLQLSAVPAGGGRQDRSCVLGRRTEEWAAAAGPVLARLSAPARALGSASLWEGVGRAWAPAAGAPWTEWAPAALELRRRS